MAPNSPVQNAYAQDEFLRLATTSWIARVLSGSPQVAQAKQVWEQVGLIKNIWET